MNAIVTTIVILVAAVVLPTGVVLYGTSLFASSVSNHVGKNDSNNTIKNQTIAPAKLSILAPKNVCDGIIFSKNGSKDLCLKWDQIYDLAKTMGAKEVNYSK